jgi:hypothetical protein
MAFSQIATSVNIFSTGLLGYMGISLSAPTNPALAPQIAAGSAIEIGGAFFKASTAVIFDATAWSAIGTNTSVFMTLTPSGTAGSQILTASYTTTHPVWSISKQGWYTTAASVIRVIGSLYKDISSQYTLQTIFTNTGFEGSITKYVLNLGYGFKALQLNTTGINNSAFGHNALAANTIGGYNSAFGYAALQLNTTGINNSAFGHNALAANTTGFYNSAFGASSLGSNKTGTNNSAFGFSSLTSNTTGTNNSSFGYASLAANTTGFYNSAFGFSSLGSNKTGTNNSAFGYNALAKTVNSYCTAFGSGALENNEAGGEQNTAFGYNALSTNTSGIFNIGIGYNAQGASPTSSNAITLGDGSHTSLRCGVTTITALSDKRDKTDINKLALGLNFINDLNAITHRWDKREWYENGIPDGSKKSKTIHLGFIAQEVDEIQKKYDAEWLNLVLKDNPDKLELSMNILPILVKAIQELSEKISILEGRN